MPDSQTQAGESPVETVGARIGDVRRIHGLSLREMARRIGVSSSYLGSVEKGEDKANANILIGIAANFPEISAKWLLTNSGRWDNVEEETGRTPASNIDVYALETALELYHRAVKEADDRNLEVLIGRQANFLSVVYSRYTEQLFRYLADGRSEGAARETARINCLALDPAGIV